MTDNIQCFKSFALLLVVLLLGSCVPHKEIIYLQEPDEINDKLAYSNPKQKSVIKAFDQLYVQVTSFDDGRINFMSNDANRYGGGRSEADLAMVSYTVDENGNINLPIIGDFNVLDLQADQAAEKIRLELELYLNAPTVKVSFVNKNVTIIGDVAQPGRYFYSSEHLNVFQAIGMAGDITIFGNRKYVVLIREVNNKVVKQRIDLTNVDLLGNNEFYLKPNDVLYVEPLKRRRWGVETFPWAIILSGVTTFVLVANYINK